jgi:hypothetical protein
MCCESELWGCLESTPPKDPLYGLQFPTRACLRSKGKAEALLNHVNLCKRRIKSFPGFLLQKYSSNAPCRSIVISQDDQTA